MPSRLVLETNYIRSRTGSSSSEESSEYSPTTHCYTAGTRPTRALYKHSPAIGEGKSTISESTTVESKQYYRPTTVKHNLHLPNPDDCHTYTFTSTGERIVPIPDLGPHPITIPSVPSLTPFYEAVARRSDGKGILEGNSGLRKGKCRVAYDEVTNGNAAVPRPKSYRRKRSHSDSQQSSGSEESLDELSYFVKRVVRGTQTRHKRRMSNALRSSNQLTVAIKPDRIRRSISTPLKAELLSL